MVPSIAEKEVFQPLFLRSYSIRVICFFLFVKKNRKTYTNFDIFAKTALFHIQNVANNTILGKQKTGVRPEGLTPKTFAIKLPG